MIDNSPGVMVMMTDIAITTLAKRTDPLIERINAGEVLTNAETKQVAYDLYNLASMMKTAAQAVDAATEELAAQDKEIAVMKQLLGLSDANKAGK